MRARLLSILLGVVNLPYLGAAHAQPAPSPLTIVSAGPTQEVASLAEAREVRVVFSEPMVALGRIPHPVTAPFFTIRPAVAGTFRWSGTTILIFTPDPTTALPYATRYDVTIDVTATATSGRRLVQPFTFSFTTPTVRLLATNWYRKDNRYDQPLVIGFRFNQPVKPADVAAHLSLAYSPHDWDRPAFSPRALARLQARDPRGLERFNAKVAASDAAARAQSPVPFKLAGSWETSLLKPGTDLVVVETNGVPPPGSWIAATLDEALPSTLGPATPRMTQSYTIKVEPAFFVTELSCEHGCDPSAWNPIRLSRPVEVARFAPTLHAFDITDPAMEAAVKASSAPPSRENGRDETAYLTLEDAGFHRQPAARSYALHVDASLSARDGQTLGYPWIGIVENWHESAFTSFGDGHGVWESSGGRTLPFHARNFTDVQQWAAPLAPGELMPTIRSLQSGGFAIPPPSAPVHRPLSIVPDRVQSFGLDLSKALSTAGRGLAWAAVREGEPIPNARVYGPGHRVHATVVQVTNLGLTVKDSPQNTLVFVTRLDNGEAVAGARVSIVDRRNQTVWSGTTGADGVAIAPDTPLRKRRMWFAPELDFLVLAEKDGDVAYLGSDWTEGIDPWSFGQRFNLSEAAPLLRGSVFADRGVYRLGEEVHAKAILRRDTPRGIDLPPAGSIVYLSLRDSQDRELDKRQVTLGEWGSAEWVYTLPADGALGNYSIQASLDKPDEGPPRLRPTDSGR